MKDTNTPDNEADHDYDPENGALDSSIRYQPSAEQLEEIKRRILHVDIDDLHKYIDDHELDISRFIMPGDEKQTLLFFAIKIKNEQNCLKVVKDLICTYGLKPNLKDAYNQTLLFYASREGFNEMVNYLALECKCEINHKDDNNQTPIYYAARENRVTTVLKLLELDADISIEDNDKQTPLYYAARKGHLEVCKLLVKYGAEVNHTDKKHNSPIQYAQRYKRSEVVEFLEEHGAVVPETWKASKKVKYKRKSKSIWRPTAEKEKDYVLWILKENRYVPVNQEEFDETFATNFPDFYEWLKNEDSEGFKALLPTIHLPENAPVYDTWIKLAQRILRKLKNNVNGWMFNEPIDPISMGILDYPTIVKKPMDFETVSEKLKFNDYKCMQEYLDDVALIFANCKLYNGENNCYGMAANQMVDIFKDQCEKLGVEYYK